MFRRTLVPIVAPAVMLAVALPGAWAAGAGSAPAPALSSLGLAPSDFRPAAPVAMQRTISLDGQAFYLRVFGNGVRVGTSRLGTAVSLALLEADAATAVSDFEQFNETAQSAAGRKALATQWGVAFVKGLSIGTHGKQKVVVKSTQAGLPIAAGPAALLLPVTIKSNLGTTHIAIEVKQADRAVVIAELLSQFNRPLERTDELATLAALGRRLQSAFTVANTTAPTLGGSLVQGQTLTVDEGAWTGAPSAFGYAWMRCDAAGANCAAIAGATANSYALTPEDAGSTVRVTVTGQNTVSSQQSVSAATSTIS
jgi:hypothetical protein